MTPEASSLIQRYWPQALPTRLAGEFVIALACGAPTARRRERSLAKGRRVPCVRSGQDRTDPFVFTNDLRSQSHFLDFLALRGRAGQPARPAEDREWDETEFLNFV